MPDKNKTTKQFDRTAFRHKLRSKRRSLSEDERLSASYDVFRHISRTNLFRNSQRIAFYLPNDGEIDLEPLIIHAFSMRKTCFLPVLDTLTSNRLWFAPFSENTSMHCNRYGIPEPDVSMRNHIRACKLDLIFLPVVAFDIYGNRLGMGGGFYDRTLSYLNHRQHWKKPFIIGSAYDFQKISLLKAEPWDIPLQAVITEKQLYMAINKTK